MGERRGEDREIGREERREEKWEMGETRGEERGEMGEGRKERSGGRWEWTGQATVLVGKATAPRPGLARDAER